MKINSSWDLNNIDLQLIDLAFAEDLSVPFSDITTHTLFPEMNHISKAKIISKHPEAIIMCGLPMIQKIIEKLNTHCKIESHFQDGDIIPSGAVVVTLEGPATILLMAERVILNFLQHLCAIATMTAKFVSVIQHTHAKILDTRKTMPGFRHLAKYAVQCGGGVNHRMGLYDAMMVKDTHIDALGGMAVALEKLPLKNSHAFPVIVEVRNINELNIVLEQGLNKVTRVLLDNMSPSLMTECVALCKNKISTEASGNVCLETILAIAESGVDFISIGKLTHSAGNVDLSMKCEI